MFLNLTIGKQYRDYEVANLSLYDLENEQECRNLLATLRDCVRQAEEEGFGRPIYTITNAPCYECNQHHDADDECKVLFELDFYGDPGRVDADGRLSFSHVERIQAIKLVRELSGMGLTQAKNFCETPGKQTLRVLKVQGWQTPRALCIFFKGCGYKVEEVIEPAPWMTGVEYPR